MKLSTFPFLALFVIFFAGLGLTSCGDLQQELFLNGDGSGKLESSFDLGEMMSMMKGFNGMGMPDDTTNDDDVVIEDTIPLDTTKKAKEPMEVLFDKITDPNYPLPFDSLISFASIIPDSVRKVEKRMDLVNKLSLHLKSPANSSDLSMGIVVNFANQKELAEIMNYMDTINSAQNVVPGGVSGAFSKEAFTMYTVDFDQGWIQFDSIDYSSFGAEMGMSMGMGMAGDSTSGGEDMGMMEMMFGNSKVRSIVHVPGEVISCSNPDALITKDDRVIIEYDIMDVIKKGKVPGYTINFKPRKG